MSDYDERAGEFSLNKEISPEEIKAWEKKIDSMTREEMARLWRFAPSGHPVFRADCKLYERFAKRFEKLGKFSPEISKKIGF